MSEVTLAGNVAVGARRPAVLCRKSAGVGLAEVFHEGVRGSAEAVGAEGPTHR
jgi:hypothetical protein